MIIKKRKLIGSKVFVEVTNCTLFKNLVNLRSNWNIRIQWVLTPLSRQNVLCLSSSSCMVYCRCIGSQEYASVKHGIGPALSHHRGLRRTKNICKSPKGSRRSISKFLLVISRTSCQESLIWKNEKADSFPAHPYAAIFAYLSSVGIEAWNELYNLL